MRKIDRLHRVGVACVLGAGLAAGISRAADSVTVTGGSVIEGQVIRDQPGDPLVVLNTGGKVIMLNRSEITGIKLDEEGRAEFKKRLDAANKSGTAAAHFEVYKWAKARRLFDCADQELSATIKADSAHPEARKILAALNKAAQAALPEAPPLAANNAPNAPAAGNEEFFIGERRTVPTAIRQNDGKVMKLCRQLLVSASPDESARKAAIAELSADGSKTVAAFTELLDPQSQNEDGRMAVLAGIEALKPVDGALSKRLANTAMGDPAEAVRQKTTALIKARNDEWAMDTMVKSYIGLFSEGGKVKDAAAEAAAGAALRQLGDKRVYEAMLYNATLEVRTQVSELSSFTTRQIDSYTVNNGANATVIQPLSFPIQFPELKITSVKTTVVAPCAALGALTGTDLGNDLEAWAKYIRKLK